MVEKGDFIEYVRNQPKRIDQWSDAMRSAFYEAFNEPVPLRADTCTPNAELGKLISNLETQGNDDMIADEAAYAYRYAARKLREVMK